MACFGHADVAPTQQLPLALNSHVCICVKRGGLPCFAGAQVWEGKNAVLTGRKMIGATNPQVSSNSQLHYTLDISWPALQHTPHFLACVAA